jgi:16S rRNA G966 N2-methylase RsmD
MNRLLFGDNLKWLADTKVFPDASVDLVYLDPPFNSNANYNVLFKEASGEASQAQFAGVDRVHSGIASRRDQDRRNASRQARADG